MGQFFCLALLLIQILTYGFDHDNMSNGSDHLFPDLSPRATIFEKVRLLEKAWLDDCIFGYPDNFFNILTNCVFTEVKGTLFMKGPDGRREIAALRSDHLAPIYGLKLPLIYLIESRDWHKRVLFGTTSKGFNALQGLLAGVLGIDLVGSGKGQYDFPFEGTACGTITGIPDHTKKLRRAGKKRAFSTHSIDNLLTVLNNGNWLYAVVAFPTARSQVSLWFEQCAQEIQNVSEKFLLRDIQKANRMAAQYVKYLERTISRLRSGIAEGMWQNGIYFFSADKVDTGISLLLPVFSGERSRPEPIRGHLCSLSATMRPFVNMLNSQELASCIDLPEREYQGFRLKERVYFDLDFHEPEKDFITVGNIFAYDVESDQTANVPVEDLTRHCLVAGATGSGKTNTLFNIMIRLWENFRVPFLVMEPTKAEYRNLSQVLNEMLVFTLGDETPGRSSPFRLNPFQFPEGISLQTHIDYLKAVFNASFVMYSPMPHILEECLYEVYRDKGWVLVTSQNAQGIARGAYPTLSDLYNKIDEVVDRIGYEDRITMDIKSALKTRINNLRIGGKGLMLDTEKSVPFDEIMTKPTILELKYMGNDDEKTFVMGLILTSLYEFYESGAEDPERENRLHHVTLIEEAHRLLKNVPTEKTSEDQANIKGKAVETFCNVLAEIRAYGEGILVSEQIPTKLAPDIMKNTNLKILHRIVSKEERETMGNTMNLDKEQMRYVSTLSQGEAIFFREGLDRPVLIRVPPAKIGTRGGVVNSGKLSQKMLRDFFRRQLPLLYRFSYCEGCKLKLCLDCEKVVAEIDEMFRGLKMEEEAVKLFLPLLITKDLIGSEKISSFFCRMDSDHAYCLEAHLVSTYIENKGRFYALPFSDINSLLESVWSQKDRSCRFEYLKEQFIKRGLKANPPYGLCRSFCKNVCLYGYDVGVICRDPVMHNQFVDMLERPEIDHRFFGDLKTFLSRNLARWTGTVSERQNGICLCYALQKMNELDIGLDLQEFVLRTLT